MALQIHHHLEPAVQPGLDFIRVGNDTPIPFFTFMFAPPLVVSLAGSVHAA